MTSVALIHHSFGPYHLARAKRLREVHPGEVHLVQLAAREHQREWAIDAPVPMTTVHRGAFEDASPKILCDGVRNTLDALQPDVVVIAGYAWAPMRAAASWAKRTGAAAVLLSDSHRLDRPRSFVREQVKRLWVQAHFDTAFTAGSLSAAYLQTLGFGSERIWRGYDVVDNDAFTAIAKRTRSRAQEVRASLGVPESFLLYVGRLSPEKNLQVLLRAFAQFKRQSKSSLELVIAGGGPLDRALREEATRSGAPVRFTGFLQQERLAELYGLAEALVLPSTSEPWGLVVNEAMASGLPIITSTSCGCAADLVFPGVNGWLVRPDDISGFARTFEELSSDPSRRARMGEASIRLISPWSLELWADALSDCIEHASERRKR